MKPMEERLAEIHRRSEVLIQKRKKRRAALMACVPLVLCLSLCGALLLPYRQSGPASGSGDNQSPGGIRQELHNETQGTVGVTSPVLRVRVEGHGFSMTHTEQPRVTEITKLLETFTAKKEPLESASGFLPNTEYAAGVDSEGRLETDRAFYFFVETEQDAQEYCLWGTMLRNIQSGKTYHLEEEELFGLKDALGIPRY